MSDLGGYAKDVDFDDGVADALIAVCGAAAKAVEGQSGSRLSWQITAQVDFAGYFSQLFAANAGVAAGDAVELANRLREVAAGATKLKEEAAKEQQRRVLARDWKAKHDARSTLEKAEDSLSGGDDPLVGPPAEEPTIVVSAPVNRFRDIPAPGRGGSQSTSSARPSDLRTFAGHSRRANDELRPRTVAVRLALISFGHSCHYGTLSGDGVADGFDRWLAANDEDVQWARTLAAAFAAAGGDHQVSSVANSALSAALRAAHVDVTRDDLVIDPPRSYGTQPTSGYADDPVNAASGNFVEHEIDLAFPGAAAALALTRCYNSFGSASGAFGPGWSSITECGLVFDAAAGTARFRLPDGREVVFPRLGDGWDRAVGENVWLASDGAGGWRACGQDGSWWWFSAAGVLLAWGTGPESDGVAVRLHRDPRGRLTRLAPARGRSVELAWGEVGGLERVVAALSSDGRRVGYRYDSAGRLTEVTGPAGTRSYRWTDPGGSGSGLVDAVVDADGVVEVENGYDERGRVVWQRSPFGRVSRFAYLPGRVTVVSDPDGSRSNTWISDGRGRLLGVVDADENRQSTSYDRWGNVVLVSERDGSATVHEYDGRGRRVRTVTPSGADVTVGYDDLDRVTTVVSEAGAVTAYTYTGEQRNPSTVTDPEGGVTSLVWEDGLLRQVSDPVGVVVRFGYDTFGDLVTVTDALGHSAAMERDEAGRVVAAVTPSGARTRYEYHRVTGLLRTRHDPDGAVWRYEHTAAGRLAAIVDPLGARTSIERSPHGEESRTVDPLGRAITRHLDDLGLPTQVELPDGSAWRFSHDALSRLTATTDPTGGVWRSEFDRSGALTATVDPTGVRVATRVNPAAGQVRVEDATTSAASGFDPLGRLTSIGQPDGSAAVLTYDRCGRVVESLDAEGGLTLIRRDAAGRPVAVTSPTGAVTSYAYDSCGRLAAAVDPLGARTTVDYDDDGRPVRQTLPTGEVAWTRYDACGRVLAHHEPGAGTSTYRYDRCGRVVWTRDPRHGRRRFGYDAAGQLVTVTDGNSRVTRYGYDALGRAVEITNPLGAVIRREFDGLNRCIAETDPLGRRTSAGYDGAGRLAWQRDPDGHTTTWTYDDAGRPLSMAVDGRVVTSLIRDLWARTVTVEDNTRAGRVSRHVLEWNRRGQLVRRSRDGRAVTWSYDADGRRTSMTTPDGSTTRYSCDAAGRLSSLEHPLLGRATFGRDAAGQLVSAAAGDLLQTWEHRDGHVVAHTVTGTGGASRTRIHRDDDGRVTAVSRDGVLTRYRYDGAGQLVEARTVGSVSRWRYDAAGRLVEESVDDRSVEHLYDLAGQLLASTGSGGRRIYGYDGLGRRTRVDDGRGGVREFGWGPTGHLASVTQHDGDRVRQTTMHVDALGELAEVGGAAGGSEFFWDSAAFAGAPVLAGGVPIVAAGPLTGIGESWTTPGWRSARADGPDPWSAGAASLPSESGFSLGAAAEVSIGGLEWMGARVYDAAAHGFLSVDPLDPVTGAGWAGNPYSYAGNDPLHALDPTGLNPVTDVDLDGYRTHNSIGDALNRASQATGHWLQNNWEYVAGGAMVVGGGALIATGVGGPLGMMLVSAGADTIIQKATTGDVNWGEVAVAGAAGAVGFGASTAVVKAGAQTAASLGLRESVAAGFAGGAADGGVFGGGSYLTGSGPHTVRGLTDRTVRGAFYGGAAGAAGGAAANGVSAYAGRSLGLVDLTPRAPAPSVRRFTSPDPHVGDAANALEADRPGWVRSVNSHIRMHNWSYREVDIDLGKVVVQVKSGNGRGLTGQMLETIDTTDRTVVGYAPDIPKGAWLNAAREGLPIARDIEELKMISRELG